MVRGRYLHAAQKYCCSYTCTRCEKANWESGFVRAADPVRPNSFTDNLGDEVFLSGEIATEKAQKKFYALQARVNGRCWYSGMRVSGRCRKCGKRQFWSPFLRHAAAAALAGCTLGGLLWLHGWPVDVSTTLMLISITAASALLTEGAALLFARLWAKHQQEEYLPWLEAVYKKQP